MTDYHHMAQGYDYDDCMNERHIICPEYVPWCVSEKISGTRCCCMIDADAGITTISKIHGYKIPPDIEFDIRRLARRSVVFDGVVKDNKYMIFDCMNFSEFVDGYAAESLSSRLYDLRLWIINMSSYNHIRMVDHSHIQSWDDLDKTLLRNPDWDGFVLRKDVEYNVGYTKDILIKTYNK